MRKNSLRKTVLSRDAENGLKQVGEVHHNARLLHLDLRLNNNQDDPTNNETIYRSESDLLSGTSKLSKDVRKRALQWTSPTFLCPLFAWHPYLTLFFLKELQIIYYIYL